MPWTVDSPPSPAKNWTDAEKRKCVDAANAVLAKGGDDDDAIFACIRAAGRSTEDSDNMDLSEFYIPTDDSADDVLLFPMGDFWRDGIQREFNKEDAELMVRNFKDNILGRLPPVNREHKRELGKVGQITKMWVTDDGVRGAIDGDLSGFDYVSPEVRWVWTHPFTGVKHANVLMGAGATNYPFFLDRMALNDDTAMLWTGSDWEPFKDTKRDELKDRQQQRAKSYSIGVKEGGRLTPAKGHPTDAASFGDPVNYRYPADEQHAQPALSYFNQSKNKSAGGYSDTEWAVIGRRLAKLISKHLTASYKYSDGQVVRRDGDEESADIKTEVIMTGELENVLVEQKPEAEPIEFVVEETSPAVDYAERLATLEEEFAEVSKKLEQEKTERERVEEAFAESEKQRRLMHYADVVNTFAVSAEPEQFAEDLFTVEQMAEELAERMIARFRAYSEAVEKGELFAQKSHAEQPEIGDPWLACVEKTRKEHFSDMPEAEGWREAEIRAQREKPELARAYADRTRGG